MTQHSYFNLDGGATGAAAGAGVAGTAAAAAGVGETVEFVSTGAEATGAGSFV